MAPGFPGPVPGFLSLSGLPSSGPVLISLPRAAPGLLFFPGHAPRFPGPQHMNNPNTHYKEIPSEYINLSFGVLSIYVVLLSITYIILWNTLIVQKLKHHWLSEQVSANEIKLESLNLLY